MKTISLRLGIKLREHYKIFIGKNLLKKIPKMLPAGIEPSTVAIVCDSKTSKLFGTKLLKSFQRRGFDSFVVKFPVGESHKNISTVEKIANSLLEKNADRNSLIVALGGGVVGDVAGFVAATYMRGVPYVQVPTTLLAMVDSSVGGKTAVDLPEGKNCIGAFYQPRAVYIDLSMLKTLPEREIRNGLAECVKTAVIADGKLFSFIEKNIKKIKSLRPAAMEHLVYKCCKIKARVVSKDERESNLRKILNYGHTVGHALEASTNYKKYSHGEAVALGMYYEAQLSHMPLNDIVRQNRLLFDFGLIKDLPKFSIEKILELMKHDKKALHGEINFALPKKIGKMYSAGGIYGLPVPVSEIRSVLE